MILPFRVASNSSMFTFGRVHEARASGFYVGRFVDASGRGVECGHVHVDEREALDCGRSMLAAWKLKNRSWAKRLKKGAVRR